MKGNKLKILIHIAFWTMVMILPWFMMSGNLEQPGFFEGRYYIRIINGGLLFYLTYFYLVPEFYLKNQKLKYFLYVAVAIALFFGVTEVLNQWLFPDDLLKQRMDLIRDKLVNEGIDFHGPSSTMRYVNSIFISVLISAFAMGLRIASAYAEKEKQNRELEKDKLASDLGLLKSQVSPHFFFNTLNNIYALTESNSPEAGNAILKLSKMMRYVLYDSEQGSTTLEHEIRFMNHYIDLMRLRLSEKVNINVDFRPHSENISLPPMIFISFVENAFKHGISYREPSFIDISLRTSPEQLNFTCRNSNFGQMIDQKGVHSGIGLENIRKRLALLYQDKHTLLINETPDVFEINLTIQL